MHSPEYIRLIEEQAEILEIGVKHYSENWAIELSKKGSKRFIVGYTFPLNDSACYKILRNKNLCSEILSANEIANVPHEVIYSPTHLEKHKKFDGNGELINNLIAQYGFPLVIKKNNSTKGDGVFLAQNDSQLEKTLARLYTTEAAFCISPFRKGVREFRNVILDGKCLLTYEKIIPYVRGDGKLTLIELLGDYVKQNPTLRAKNGKLFDPVMMNRLTSVPELGENISLQWNHNRLVGTTYPIVENEVMASLAVQASLAVNSRFATVDIVTTPDFGMEVLEINASVGLHLTFCPRSSREYGIASGIYRAALQKVFDID